MMVATDLDPKRTTYSTEVVTNMTVGTAELDERPLPTNWLTWQCLVGLPSNTCVVVLLKNMPNKNNEEKKFDVWFRSYDYAEQ